MYYTRSVQYRSSRIHPHLLSTDSYIPVIVKLILNQTVEGWDGLDRPSCARNQSPDKSPSPLVPRSRMRRTKLK